LGARCVRRHALRAGAGAVDARSRHEQNEGGPAGTLTLRLGLGGVLFWVFWPTALVASGADGKHSDLFDLLVCVGTGHQHCHAGGGALRSGLGMGGEWNTGATLVAKPGLRISRQGYCDSAEFVAIALPQRPWWQDRGNYLDGGGFFRRNPAGALDFVDTGVECGIEDVEERQHLDNPRPRGNAAWALRTKTYRVMSLRIFHDFSSTY